MMYDVLRLHSVNRSADLPRKLPRHTNLSVGH